VSTATTPAPPLLQLSLDCYPHFNRFALDFVRGAEPARDFLQPLDLAGLKPQGQRKPQELIDGLVRTNASWGNDVAATLQHWGRGETVTLIAGQQVGFAGGPLYTLAKLSSLLRVQRDLSARGIPATVFFWLATEDHDFAEVSRLILPTRDGHRELRVAESPGVSHVVGRRPVPESLRQQFLNITGASAPDWLPAGITFGESFARLLVSVLGSGTVVLVDSLLPELRRAGRPLFQHLLKDFDEVQSLVGRRSAQIESRGYTPQVEPNSDGEYSLLFVVTSDGERHAVRKAGTSWLIGTRPATSSELERLITDQPESISTGALARPLLQDAVFQPDLFVGGPAEVAYYAQVSALHQRLGIRMPGVALRGHALVAPTKVLRAFEKYDLRPSEIFLPVEEWIARHETHAVAKLDGMLQTTRDQIEVQLEKLRTFVVSFDPTMDRTVDHSLRKIRYQLQRVGEKGKRAIARRDADRYRAISRLSESLVPKGEPQDRVVGWMGYWLQYGAVLVDRLVSEIEPDSDRLKVIGL